MQSLLQILVINTKTIPAKGDRKAFDLVEAECLLLNDDGTPAKVGGLRIPDALKPKAKPGIFIGSFGLEVSWKDRSIGALLSDLQEVKLTDKGPVPVSHKGS